MPDIRNPKQHGEIIAEELKAIRERAEKATEGPWQIVTDSHDDPAIAVAPETEQPTLNVCFVGCAKDGNTFHDADFIAHARTDIPKLLAELQRVTEELRGFQHGDKLVADALKQFQTDCSTPTFQLARNAVQELARVTKERDALRDGWVSVEERLPRVWAGVLGVEDGAVWTVHYRGEGQGWGMYSGDADVSVTHWRLLPDPPVEGK